MSTCKSCGAEIIWIKTLGGNAMPCNLDKKTVVTEGGQVVTGRTSHFATCPEANKWRKK